MARLSPITIGVSMMAVVVMGAAVGLVVVRWRRAAEPAVAEAPAEGAPPAIAPAALHPVAAGGAKPAAPPPSPSPAQAAAPAAAGEDRDEAAAGEPVTDAAAKKRELLIAGQNQKLMEEADESAFELLKIAEPARAAIRKLNEDFDAKTQSSPGAERARQDAISGLLGADAAEKFDAAERAGVHRLRGKYRWERARLLRE